MSNSKTRLILFGAIAVTGLWAGCAWDNSPPPYHSVIQYDPSRAQTYVSAAPSNNAPSIRDWKTDEDVGIGYGSAGYGSNGPSAAPTAGQPVGGAVSTPSGVSSGGAAGATTPGSGTPGTIIGGPASTGGIGVSPGPAPITAPAPITTSPALSAPLSPGLNSTLSRPTSTFGTPGPTGPTNTSSGVIFTNRYTAPTNTLLNPGLGTPTP